MKIAKSRKRSAAPDLVLGANGLLYVNASLLAPAEKKGRRKLRVVELTADETAAVSRTLGEVACDLLVGVLPQPKAGARRRRL